MTDKLTLYGIFDRCCHERSNIVFLENRDRKGWYQCKKCNRLFEGKMQVTTSEKGSP